MLFIDGGLGLILFLLWVFCLIDVIVTDESRCRNLPKLVWVLIVLIGFDIGAIMWLVAGHPWQPKGQGLAYLANKGSLAGAGPRDPEYDRPGRIAASNPDDDEAFLAQLRKRADSQRREYQQQRSDELRREQDDLSRKPNED
jgi:hypothetical protein